MLSRPPPLDRCAMSKLLMSSLALVVAMDLASALLLSTAVDPAHYLEHAWWHQTGGL